MLHPTIKWAQRKDKIYIELSLRDIANEKVDLTTNSISFKGQSNKEKYEFFAQFFQQVTVQQSKWSKNGFHMLFALQKKDKSHPYWPRLTKENKKSQYIQIDWNKWIDEDEQQEQANKGLSGLNEENMQNFPDSDDEEEQKKQEEEDLGNIDDLEGDQPLEKVQE